VTDANESEQTVPEQTGTEQTRTGQGTGYTLQQFPEKLAVVRLPAGSEIPPWAESSSLLSITATATETSVICAGRDVPTKVVARKGLTAFAVQDGPTHESAGVLSALLAPLAEEGISIFTVSTYETNWILVPVTQAERAGEAWTQAGHTVVVAVPVAPSRKGRR
jgi:uncharacterized protein